MIYKVNEIFYSLQGEGVRVGVPHLFLRFSGCNQLCTKATVGFNCDTSHASFELLSSQNIIDRLHELNATCKWVLITGGEPLLQLDCELVSVLKSVGYQIAIETNGTIEPDCKVLQLIDWISCSPKSLDLPICLSYCNELKYVLSVGMKIPELPKQFCNVANRIVSPAWDGMIFPQENFKWCEKLVKANPNWRLSIQMHKLCGIA